MSVRISRLDNGLRVVSHAMAGLETASLGVWVDAGARHEADEEHGIAHLLEHMAFKGTERRSARQIAEEIEAVGGDLNAATGLEHTAYYARTLKGDIEVALDILADILRHPRFDEGELALEREVIAQEIGTARDVPEDHVFELFHEAAFPGQPLGRSILGTETSLGRHDAAALQGFRNAHYAPGSMVLAAAGAVDHDSLVRLAAERLGEFAAEAPAAPPPARYAGGERREPRALEQAHLLIGFEGIGYHDDDVYAVQVLSGLLGGGMSSRLFQEAREARGLCYAIYSFAWSYRDSGLFGIYAGTGAGSLEELVAVITGELEAVADRVGEDEAARARAQLKAGLMMSLESSSARAEQIARQLMVFGRVLPIDEMIERVESVDTGALSRLAERLVMRAPPTLAAVGPLERLESYDRIAARLR